MSDWNLANIDTLAVISIGTGCNKLAQLDADGVLNEVLDHHEPSILLNTRLGLRRIPPNEIAIHGSF